MIFFPSNSFSWNFQYKNIITLSKLFECPCKLSQNNKYHLVLAFAREEDSMLPNQPGHIADAGDNDGGHPFPCFMPTWF